MSYQPNIPNYNPSHQLPQHLDHKPVFALPYEKFDGIHSGSTDVQYISVGISQYDNSEVSVKTMRYANKWSRQAEELPVHRPIDMTLFLAKAIFDEQNGTVTIPTNTMQGQTGPDIVVTAETRTQREMAAYRKFINAHQNTIKARLNALWKVLDDLKTQGKI